MDGTAKALTQVLAALRGIDHAERGSLASRERLELVSLARTACRTLEALMAVLIAEADEARASLTITGTPTSDWLAATDASLTQASASRLVMGGREVAARPAVRDAALGGALTVEQARAVSAVMGGLPDGLSPEERVRTEQLLLQQASAVPAGRIPALAEPALASVCPAALETAERRQQRLAARHGRARARRGVTFTDDGDGAWRLSGSLPIADAAPLKEWIDAHAAAAYRAARERREQGSPEPVTVTQRRADALLELGRAAQPASTPWAAVVRPGGAGAKQAGGAATASGQRVSRVRTRLVVVMTEQSLRDRVEPTGRLLDGSTLSAGELRRLACAADVTPVVLGADSEILDVGQDQRLVTPALRKALVARDGGCAFPGCSAPHAACDAHHIVPWWRAGPTTLANLVLLCPHHHGLVEPPRFWSDPPPDRWSVRLDVHGYPEFLPPLRLDPLRRAVRANPSPLRAS